MSAKKFKKNDDRFIWYPYSEISTLEKKAVPIITHGKGCYLYDSHGKKYLDGIASWWCVNLGHSVKPLIKAIKKQTGRLQHSMLGGLSHQPAIELSQKLAAITPAGLKHCFYASDGASAVESALRMALQYWQNIGDKKRLKFIALQDGYHGDTLGAVNLGYVEEFHKELLPILNKNYRALSPHCARCPFKKEPQTCQTECFDSMAKLIKKHHSETAAVIVEPLCQGAAGIRIYPATYLKKLRKLCTQYKLLLIADEIAVGFGRTGAMFACQKAGITPDIMTIGKGLTGGYLPLSAAIVNEKIYTSFRRGHTFYYGHTFCGNPIAASAALAAIDQYERKKILNKVNSLSSVLAQEITELAGLLNNSFCQTLGLIGMIELNKAAGGSKRASKITTAARNKGVLLRPLGPVLYLWPPLTITKKELLKTFKILHAIVEEF